MQLSLLRDPHEMRLGFVAEPWIAATRCERAGGAVSVANVSRQDLEAFDQTDAVQSDRAKAMSEVTRLADRLVQEADDLVGRRGRPWLRTGRQTSGERRTQRGDAGEGLTQPVVQFAPEALLFVIGDRKDFPLQQLLSPNVAGLGHNSHSGVADHCFTNKYMHFPRWGRMDWSRGSQRLSWRGI